MGTASKYFGEAPGVCAAWLDSGARRSSSAIAPQRLNLACVFVAVLLLASPVAANVFEISHNGSVSVRDGAGAATWEAVGARERALDQVDFETIFPANATTIAQSAAVPQRFAGLIEIAAASAKISPALLAALVWQESRWNSQAVSSKGAIGLTQLMPATARDLGVDPRDPVGNLTGGALYLRQQLDHFGGDVEKALAAYNAGPGRVSKANGVPAIAETQAYVRSIVQRVSSFRQEVR